MSSISGGPELLIPNQLNKTLAQGRLSLPDRGMKLTATVINIATKSNEEAITKSAEETARKLLGTKVQTTV